MAKIDVILVMFEHDYERMHFRWISDDIPEFNPCMCDDFLESLKYVFVELVKKNYFGKFIIKTSIPQEIIDRLGANSRVKEITAKQKKILEMIFGEFRVE